MDSIAVKSCTNKKCLCVNPQPLTLFSKDRSKKDGLALWCKTCANAVSRAWIKNNPEKNRVNVRKWTRAHPEKHLENALKWNRANPERVKANSKRWREMNARILRWRARVDQANRRAKAYGAPGILTRGDVLAKLELQGGLCYYCKILLDDFDIDHKIPFALGGTNWPANICCACESCNSQKRNKNFWEFSGKRRP